MKTHTAKLVPAKAAKAGLALTALAFLVLTGCTTALQQTGQGSSRPDERQAETARVAARRVLDQLVQAHNNADIEAVMTLFADDAVLAPPNEPEVRGKRRIRAWYQRRYAGTVSQLGATSRESEGEEWWAFDRGTIEGRIYDREEIEANDEVAEPIRVVNDKYAMMLRKELNRSPDEDGMRWRIMHFIWNPSTPLGTSLSEPPAEPPPAAGQP